MKKIINLCIGIFLLIPLYVKSSIVEINTNAELQKILSEPQTKVIKFYLPKCSSCIRLAPLFKRMAKQNSDIIFVAINVTDLMNIAMNDPYNVTSLPTVIFFNETNKEVNRLRGNIREKKFTAALEQIKTPEELAQGSQKNRSQRKKRKRREISK